MNLIKLETPEGVEYHGIAAVSINPPVGQVEVTLGVWLAPERALVDKPLTTDAVVLHMGDWQPEYLETLFSLVCNLPEFAQGVVVSALTEHEPIAAPEMSQAPVAPEPPEATIFDVGAAPVVPEAPEAPVPEVGAPAPEATA